MPLKRSVDHARARLARGMGAIRRIGWGLGDQAVSSVTNFAVASTVAHLLGARELGAYSLAFVTYAVALNMSRGLATDPLLVRLGGADHNSWRTAVAQCTGTALIVGVAGGAVVIGAALLVAPPIRGALLALGVTLPLLLLQDSWRFAFFVAGRGDRAFVNDLVWAATLLPALTFVALTGHRTAFGFVLAWGCSAGVAAFLGWRQTRVTPRPSHIRAWLNTHRDLNVRFMAEGMLGSLAGQLRAYGTGAALGLVAVGYLQVVMTVMGPFQILLFGIGAVIIPELASHIRRPNRSILRPCLLLGMSLASVAVAWGVVVWVLLPHGLGQVLVGDIWQHAHAFVPLAVLGLIGTGISGGAGAGLHALGASRRSLNAMLVASVLVVVLSVGGAAIWGLQGTLAGTAVAAWVGAGLSWWHLVRAESERLSQPVGVVA